MLLLRSLLVDTLLDLNNPSKMHVEKGGLLPTIQVNSNLQGKWYLFKPLFGDWQLLWVCVMTYYFPLTQKVNLKKFCVFSERTPVCRSNFSEPWLPRLRLPGRPGPKSWGRVGNRKPPMPSRKRPTFSRSRQLPSNSDIFRFSLRNSTNIKQIGNKMNMPPLPWAFWCSPEKICSLVWVFHVICLSFSPNSIWVVHFEDFPWTPQISIESIHLPVNFIDCTNAS